MSTRLALLTVVLFGAFAAPAAASTLQLDGSTLTYDAAPGESNHLTISLASGTLTVTDTGATERQWQLSWKRWGMDADGDHKASVYDPVDAIFSTARYLRASGAPHNYHRAIYAYNHAGCYVRDVLHRAKLFRA